jgi:hypothetical protein
MEDSHIVLPELVNIKCQRTGEGVITLHFDYKSLVGPGKLFRTGIKKTLHERSSRKGYKIMLQTGFSVN